MSETDIVLGRIKYTLDQLGSEISNGKYPADLLSDLKSSVDELRLTMWAVIEAEEQRKQEIKGGSTDLKKKLVEFRIKRILQMLQSLRIDVAEPGSSDLEALRAALRTGLQNVERVTARKT